MTPDAIARIRAGEPLPETVRTVLKGIHPDPFVQSAILRVMAEAPGVLDPYVVEALTNAFDA